MIQAHAIIGQAGLPKGSFIHLAKSREILKASVSLFIIPQCSAGLVLWPNKIGYLILCYLAFDTYFYYTANLLICGMQHPISYAQLHSLGFNIC